MLSNFLTHNSFQFLVFLYKKISISDFYSCFLSPLSSQKIHLQERWGKMSRHACSIINIQVRDIYSWRDDQRLLVNFMFRYFRLVSIMVMVVVTVFLLVLPLVLPPLPPPPLLLLLVPVLIMAALVFLAFSPQKYQVIQHPPPWDHTKSIFSLQQ